MEPTTTVANCYWSTICLLGILTLVALFSFISYVISSHKGPKDPRSYAFILLFFIPFLSEAQNCTGTPTEEGSFEFWCMAALAVFVTWTLAGWVWYTAKHHPKMKVPLAVILFGPFSGFLKKTSVVLLLCLPMFGFSQGMWKCEISTPEHIMCPRIVYDVDIFSTEGVVQLKWNNSKVSARFPQEMDCQSIGFSPTNLHTEGDLRFLEACEVLPAYFEYLNWYSLRILSRDGEPIEYYLTHYGEEETFVSYKFTKVENP